MQDSRGRSRTCPYCMPTDDADNANNHIVGIIHELPLRELNHGTKQIETIQGETQAGLGYAVGKVRMQIPR